MTTNPRSSAWSSPLLAALDQAVDATSRPPNHPELDVSNIASPDLEVIYRRPPTTKPSERGAVTALDMQLRAVVAAEQHAAALHERAVATRDSALLEAAESGLTFYRIHKITGLAQSAVAKSVNRARSRRDAQPPGE